MQPNRLVRFAVGVVGATAILARPAPIRASGPDDSATSGGKIDTARDRTEGGGVRDHRGDRADDDSDSSDLGEATFDDDDDDDTLGGLIGLGIMYVIASPLWVPPTAVEDVPFPRAFAFESYPYARAAAGAHTLEVPSANPWAFQAQLMASYQPESDGIDARRVRLGLRSNRRLDLEADMTRYDEAVGDSTDHLWHWKAMALYSFAVSERVRFSAGAGLRGFRFLGGVRSTGVAGRYAAEFFPHRPLHLWLTGEAGVNSSEFAGEVDIGAGLLLGRAELMAGYRLVRVVGVNFGGLTVGLGAWF